MANHSITLTNELYAYLLDQGVREADVLQALRLATEEQELSVMRSAPEQGQFLAMLIRLTGAKRIVEVGTYTGYATLWMALALADDGEIISCDISEQWTSVACRFWKKAGVERKIKLKLAPAVETLNAFKAEGLSDSFDMIFIDADKESYDQYYEASLKLLRPGGLIVIDNVLWGGSVIDETKQNASTIAIRALNRKLKTDERVDLAMLPVADGLTLALKR